MTFPDTSVVVRTPIVVPVDALLLILKLLIVIAMSLSALSTVQFVPFGKLPVCVTAQAACA
jgi:hypothetical protein